MSDAKTINCGVPHDEIGIIAFQIVEYYWDLVCLNDLLHTWCVNPRYLSVTWQWSLKAVFHFNRTVPKRGVFLCLVSFHAGRTYDFRTKENATFRYGTVGVENGLNPHITIYVPLIADMTVFRLIEASYMSSSVMTRTFKMSNYIFLFQVDCMEIVLITYYINVISLQHISY